MKPNAGQVDAAILKVVLGYAAFAALWILLSDRAIETLLQDPGRIAIASTLKGWFFVAITSLLLYRLMLHRFGAAKAASSPPLPAAQRVKPSLYIAIALLSVAIVAATAMAIISELARHKAKEAASLQAIADHKIEQLAIWLKERRSDAEHVHGARAFVENYRGWREAGDAASRTHLLMNIEQFRASKGYRSASLVGEQGELLWNSANKAHLTEPKLLASIRQALAEKKTSHLLAPYRDNRGDIHFDLVVRLGPHDNARPSPFVILGIDPAAYLLRLLQSWPVPSASAEIQLFRRDGESVLFLNKFRHRPDFSAEFHMPLATEKLLAAQVLRGEAKVGSLIEGEDYRAVPVMGVVRAVPGTDWFLLAKLDRVEFFAEARNKSALTALAGLLALFAVFVGAIVLHQRQRLAEAREKREAQDEKIRTLQLLNDLAEGAEDGMFVKDAEGRYLLYNHAACLRVGKTKQEVLGRDSAAIYPPGEAARLAAVDREVMRENRTMSTDEYLSTVNGIRTMHITRGPLHDAKGKVIGLFGISRDITERNATEQQLRKLSLAVEQSPESIVITNVNAEIEYVNAAFTQTTGYRPEEVIGKNPRMLQSGKTPPQTHQAMWDTLTQGQSWKGEFRNRRKDGSEYIEFAVVTPIRQADGLITHYVAVKEDVTDKKRLGAELDQHRHHLEQLVASRTAQLEEARERAEVANTAKSAFLANMSHEIRTPMNAIIGLTHILSRTRPTPEQADKLAKIASSANHLLAIINDVLDLSKIEAGKFLFEQRPFRLAGVIDEVYTAFEERAREKGIALICRSDGATSAVLIGDPLRLRQILFNLVGNAVKFTERGAVVFEATCTEKGNEQVGIEFCVTDTGIGMTGEEINLLFQPFSQVDTSITRRFGGTGLGLAISRQLATLMGGELSVESRAGAGSIFRAKFHFNIGADDTADSQYIVPLPSMPDSLDGVRIFLAEDQPLNREVACGLLEAAGARITIAANGRQAIDMLVAAGPDAYDLVLMDIQMPEMDGLTATRVLRRIPGFETLPILAMTAHVLPEETLKIIGAGMNGHIGKPFEPTELFAHIRTLLPQAAGTMHAPDAAGDGASVAPNPSADIDIAGALPRFGGRGEMYSKWLLTFASGVPALAGDIASALQNGDAPLAKRHVHTCKGQAGTLGLTALHNAAAKLDASLKNGECDTLLLEAFRHEAERATAIARVAADSLAQETGAGQAASATPLSFAAELAQLRELIVSADGEAPAFCASLQARIPDDALGGNLTQVAARLASFDYDKALTLLDGQTP